MHANIMIIVVLYMAQISKNHYQNALTATRMDSTPQTPDVVDPDIKGRPPGPEARSNSIALPLMSTHTRLGLGRFAHLHPYGGLHSTSQLNERNRIVREFLTCFRCNNSTQTKKKDMEVINSIKVHWSYVSPEVITF